MQKKIGIVVPTIGTRPEFLPQALKSIRAAGDAHILLIAPKTFDPKPYLELIDQFEVESKPNLPSSINEGIAKLPSEIEYINWLGDDDLLMPNSLNKALEVLISNPNNSFVFGACDYIDPKGERVMRNKSGQWAVPLLRVGPDLVPQPGALFTRKAFNAVGGLDTTYGWAFDFDLFIKLAKIGKGKYIPETLSNFRWHPDSLSVKQRETSAKEASKVRYAHLPKAVKPFAFIWEWPIALATVLAGVRVSYKANSKA